MRWDLVLERLSLNKLNSDITRKKLRKIGAAAERNKALGFVGRIGKIGEPELTVVNDEEAYRYRVKLRLEKTNSRGDEEAAEKQYGHILAIVERCASSQGWRIVSPRETTPSEQESKAGMGAVAALTERPRFVVPELTQEVMNTFFAGIYEREEQIRNIHAAVQMAQDTNGEIIPHVLLYGRPGACKTKLTEHFKAWYDSTPGDVERVKFVDCTTMTQAGVENWLLDQASDGSLPEVLVLDEVEKQDKKNLSSFLSIMGSGIIARLNARIGNRRERASFVVIGICNDEQQLKVWNDGALWSRFGGNKLFCPRPSYELCDRILKELVKKIPGGKREWAEAALKFGWHDLGERDIREIKDHLCGRDRLLTGGWQKDKLKMLAAKQKEEAEVVQAEEKPRGLTYVALGKGVPSRSPQNFPCSPSAVLNV